MNIIRIFLIGILTLTFFNCNNRKESNTKYEDTKTLKNNIEKIKGNYILFLRPSDEKFDANKNENGIYEADSDFGFAIKNTVDSLKSNPQFQNIKSNITTKRYVEIENCKNCPKTVDRDSIFYGIILTAPNKEIKVISGVRALNYFTLIEEYFR
jgi:PBP1b-binding outer membrane lipoprotein LpoB